MAPQDSGPIIVESGKGKVPDDLASWHMTSGGEPMTPEDRCLRLEEIAIKMSREVEALKWHQEVVETWINLATKIGFGAGVVMLVFAAILLFS